MKILKYLILVIFFGIFLSACTKKEKNSLPVPTPIINSEAAVLVTLTLDFGDSLATYSAIKAKNAYKALQVVAKDETLEVKTKEYDFGILVESIGEYDNGEKAWMYYVNGVLGDKSADKYELKDNDVVLWRYEKPSF